MSFLETTGADRLSIGAPTTLNGTAYAYLHTFTQTWNPEVGSTYTVMYESVGMTGGGMMDEDGFVLPQTSGPTTIYLGGALDGGVLLGVMTNPGEAASYPSGSGRDGRAVDAANELTETYLALTYDAAEGQTYYANVIDVDTRSEAPQPYVLTYDPNVAAAATQEWRSSKTVTPTSGEPAPPAEEGPSPTVTGTAGADRFSLSCEVSQTATGGEGMDKVVYAGPRGDFTIVQNSDGTLTVTCPQGAADTLNGVEIITFTDNAVIVDEMNGGPRENGIFRFYNTETGTHFYTKDPAERDAVLQNHHQYTYEGTAMAGAAEGAEGATPVHRFYNNDKEAHFYTASAEEKSIIEQTMPGFTYEGIAYYMEV